ATCEQFLCLPAQLTRRKSGSAWKQLPSSQLEALAAKMGGCAGPRLKAAQAVENFAGRAVEVNLPVFFLKDRGQGRERMILGNGTYAALLQPTQGFYQQVGAQLSQPRSQRDRRI